MKQIRKVNKEGMRQNNVLLVFETIYRNEGITRTQLAAKTRMSTMAIGRIVDFLIKNKMVFDSLNENSNNIGRPASRLYLNRNIENIGVSLDSGGIYIGRVDPYGKIIKFHEHKFSPEGMAPEEVLGVVAEQIEKLINENSISDIQSIGMVIPGLIECDEGIVKYSSQLKWKDVPVVDILESYPFIPKLVIDNDIKSRAQAEDRVGSGNSRMCSVLLNIGSGVGAGIIIGGEIYRGKDNFAGEIGHTMLSMNNRICECGRKGCIETNISLPAVLREARAVEPDIDIAGLEAAYKNDVLWARTLLDMTAEHIKMVIDMLANTYAPDVIVLCGSLMDQCETLRNIIVDAYRIRGSEMFNNRFDLKFSKFGPDGNIIGAATLAFNYNLMQFIANSAPSETVL